MIQYISFLLGVVLVALLIMAVVFKEPCRVSFTGAYENISQTCTCIGKEVPVSITQENKKIGGQVIGGELEDMPVETKELTMCYGFISEKVLKY